MTTDAMPKFGFAEAKDRLSALTASANETGLPFVITKGKKPWVEVRPLAVSALSRSFASAKPNFGIASVVIIWLLSSFIG